MKKVINGLLLICIVASSCSKHELHSAAYYKYVQNENNGLRKTVVVDNWEYTFQYKPYDYIMYSESRGNATFDRIKRLQTLKGTAWFNISFRRKDGQVSPLRYQVSSLDEYNQRLDYFLNRTANNIRLIYDHDTLKPMSYLFETNYNLTPQETIVVGFSLPPNVQQPGKDMQLAYYDEVFKNGIIKATYSANDLNNIPNLIF